MAILTNAKIKEACEFVVAASEKYQRLQWIAYNTMLRTGCREGEIVDLWRWRLTNVGTYVMKTEKSGADRTFEAVNLPIEYQGIILAVDHVLDMFRTSVNVWSDCCGASVVERLTLTQSTQSSPAEQTT